jgi:hypothetical protein
MRSAWAAWEARQNSGINLVRLHMHMRDRLAASLRKMCSLSAPQRDAIDALEADHIENGD